jgi:hypothetical protein
MLFARRNVARRWDMTNLLDATLINTPEDHAFGNGLWGYLAAVTACLDVGLESCAVDLVFPASAYIALDGPVPGFPERDLALLWDERFGWSAAVETHVGEDLIVLTHHSGGLVPRPSEVHAFVSAVRAGDHSIGQPNPPAPTVSKTRPELALLLRAYELTN